jgi:hypothetical protein
MATQTIEFRSPPSQTVTAKLFAVGSDTQVDSQSATEATNRKGTYAAAYTDVAAGEYELIAFVGAVPVARWFVTLTLATTTFQVYDKAKTELIATNAVNAASLAADAVTEIQSGLATPTNITAATGITLAAVTHTGAVIPTVTTVTNGLDAAGVRTAIGLTVANLDTQLADLPTVAEFEARTIVSADYFVVGDYTAPPSASTISSQVAYDLATAHGAGSWTTATGFSTLTQADIRTAVGLTTANLDTQIGNIQSDTNDIQTRLPAALESGRIAAALDSAARVKLDGTQPDYAPLLASGYIAPANSDITAIKVKTDNLPSDPADQSLVIAATDAVMGRLGAPAGASMSADIAAVKTDTGNLVSRITANLFSGITYLSRWLGALAGKTADTTTRTEINATTAGAGYNETTDSLEAQKDSGGGGGGDATLAKQEEILAALQGVEAIQVASPNVQGNLVLTQGDDYDGVANPKASWTVTTDYTTGWTVRLTIRDVDDTVIYTTTGNVVSSTVVAVAIAAPTGLTMTGCPGQWQGKFDVELTHSSGKKKTIALGTCYINEDQTR